MGVRGFGLTEPPLSFVKWDHSRDLMEAADADGRPAVHAQTLAAYRLLDVLRSRHPGVEIESCASGGERVGPPRSHMTGRVHDLSFRVATALFGSFGFEWDLTQTAPDERRQLAEAVSTYKRLRALLHSGDVVHGDVPDPSARLHAVVALDGTTAVFAYVQLTSCPLERPAPVVLPGLSQRRRSRSRAIATYCTVHAARVRAWKTSWKPNQLGEGLGRLVA